MTGTKRATPPKPAEIYETVMVRHIFGPLADETVRLVQPGPSDRVLDVACGTAVVTRKIAPEVGDDGHLAGVDMNPDMIDVARAISEDDGISAQFWQCHVEDLPFDDEAFDWVFCQQGLQFFTEKDVALREIQRVLDDGGRAVISVWRRISEHPGIEALNDAAVNQLNIEMFEDPFSLGDPEDLERCITGAGFREVRIEPVSITMRADDPMKVLRMILTGAAASIPSLQALTPEERSEQIDRVMSMAWPAIESHIVSGRLVFDWHANVAIARK
jgi:ubiquinone/menaquinone biosynthesis C-methylase UbiE